MGEFTDDGLGGSATPGEGISAEVVEVGSFEELEALGKEGIAGKIVFTIRTWTIARSVLSTLTGVQ